MIPPEDLVLCSLCTLVTGKRSVIHEVLIAYVLDGLLVCPRSQAGAGVRRQRLVALSAISEPNAVA
jgi:hypothetical protein